MFVPEGIFRILIQGVIAITQQAFVFKDEVLSYYIFMRDVKSLSQSCDGLHN